MHVKAIHLFLFPVLAGFSLLCSCNGEADIQPIREVSFTNVRLTDSFWAPRIEINRTVSIPSAFRQCEVNGRFDNFALAAGLIEGEHQGDFSFDDTDPYKIIEGASYSLAAHYDPMLDSYLDSIIGLIAAAQEPDGYLTTCVTNRCERLSGWWGSSRWERINSHELYNSGHLYEAAVAHYQATGKRSLLDVARKNADLICEVFGPGEGQKHVPSGHPIVEMALSKLYKVTGEQRYLDLAQYFIEETGRGTDGHKLSEYSQDHMPILEQKEIVGHAVRAGYLYSGVADVAMLTADHDYLRAITRLWENMAGRKLYITGGIGSRPQGEGFGPDYELHNMENYCETCASIANVYWNYRMFLATGDAKYVDVYERAMYNGVISGVSLSGDLFFYDNPLESMGQHERQPWFGCACCPGNVTRFMASVPGYIYAVRGDDIYVNMYARGRATIETDNNRIDVVQTTRYPWDGGVTMAVTPEKPGRFAVKFRIPGWTRNNPVGTDLYTYTDGAKSVTISVNGKKFRGRQKDGYVTIERNWTAGDLVELNLPMEVRRVRAHDNVKADAGKLAIERGPVVYCLEGCDQPDGMVFNKYIPEDTEFEAIYDKDFLNGVIRLVGIAGQVDKEGSVTEDTCTAIPYSTWCNRGAGQMIVWLPTSADGAYPSPESTIASRARALEPDEKENGWPGFNSAALYQSAGTDLPGIPVWGVNDQWEPASSSDIGKPYYCWFGNRGQDESVAYLFDTVETVSETEVYWLDFDHYDVNYRVPQSWELFYLTGEGRWQPVDNEGDYTAEKDRYNVVKFKPVTTAGLKITARPQQGASGGIIEWKVK
ncbi:MAG: glycoside hydrolase family 127 protein [Bacteroidales bacterium]|nr:glycoside hydrolase family 127 protein [Bacteroidales bacterium]